VRISQFLLFSSSCSGSLLGDVSGFCLRSFCLRLSRFLVGRYFPLVQGSGPLILFIAHLLFPVVTKNGRGRATFTFCPLTVFLWTATQKVCDARMVAPFASTPREELLTVSQTPSPSLSLRIGLVCGFTRAVFCKVGFSPPFFGVNCVSGCRRPGYSGQPSSQL